MFLKKLISIPGLSGFETSVREIIQEEWQPLVDELSISRLGSLHGLRKGRAEDPRPALLIAAHMDAIGLMVRGINKEGFIRITHIGGIDPRILPGQLVTIHGKENIQGVVIQPPYYLLPASQSGKVVDLEYLFVDTGFLPKEVNRLISVGDPISFAQDPLELSGETLAGHSMDNRASVAALTHCLGELQHIVHDWDVWAVATVQEETTFGGAYTSPFEIRPDLAVAVDVTFGKGPGLNDYRGYTLDKGPAIGWGPNIHPSVHKEFKQLAARLDMPHQIEALPVHSGTDAEALQVVAEGIPTGVISIPLRYMHTPVELVCVKDIERTGRLLSEFIARLGVDFIAKMKWEAN